MALNSVYTKYFQKSKVFLYPLLGIKRGVSVVPIETYISWKGYYNSEDMKLICVYDVRTDEEYKNFERNVFLPQRYSSKRCCWLLDSEEGS